MPNVDNSQIYVGEGLGAAGGWLNGHAQLIEDRLEGLKNKLAPLQEAWTQSQAASYYEGLQQEWNIAAEGLLGPNGILGQIAHTMNVNWGNYTDAEWSNIQTWKH
jgi:uncharacterized protein YukE